MSVYYDVVLLANTQKAAEVAINTYQSVARSLGLTVSLPKTKFMVTGIDIMQEEKEPIEVEAGMIESFQYLGSIITDDGRIDAEIDKGIASASRDFGALRQAVFKDNNLSVDTKRKAYQSCVLLVLLYGEECWTPLKRKLDVFHHRCIHTVLGITNR